MKQMDTGISAPGFNLLFADFIAYLHRQGFIIGVDHHLRLQTLLNKLDPNCKPGDLKFLLCPIFATNKKQQQQFYRSFDSYFKLLEAGAAGKPSPGDIKKTKADEAPEETVKTRKWQYILLGVLLSILIGLLSNLLTPPRTIKQSTPEELKTTPKPITDPGPKKGIDPTPSSQLPEPSFEYAKKWAEEIERFNKPGPEDRDEPGFYRRYGHIIRWVAVLAPFIFLLLMEGYRHSRRRLMLEQQRGKKPPLVWPIKVETPEPALVKNEQFYQAARLLRERLKSDVTRLDVDKTITSTIQKAGFPVFQYKAVTRPPEYLILIDLPAYRDHYAHLFDSIANALENQGLFVQRYFYETDPRVCFKEPDGERFYLSDLKTRYSQHRLIVFGDGQEFLDPVSGELDKWTALFNAWRERAVLTTEPPKNWGMREVVLAQKFIVLPASLNGLGALKTFFDTRMKPDLKSWKQGDSQPLPPQMDDEYDISGLNAYLGEDTFQWLCACAVYPELHWDLTLYLGSLQCMPAILIREENVLRMIRLPWFRTGSMPDELRWELIRRLDPNKSRAVRAAIVELLEKNPAPRGSFAYDTYRLHLVLQRWMLSRKDRKRRKEMLKSMKSVPEKQVIQDYTLLRYRESMHRSRLHFILPKRLRKLFYRKGVPLFGFKAGIRMALTVLIAAAFFIFLKGPRTPGAETPGFPEVVALEGGVFFMGSPSTEVQRKPSEWPRHQVTLDSFAMGKYEVTNAQFAAFLNEKGNREGGGGPWLNLNSTYTKIKPTAENEFEVEKGYENHPVVGVGWYGAWEYCDWLTEKTLIPFRLPTEAEWEYACRAGTGTEYSFGNDPADHKKYGWFLSNAGTAGPREVGLKTPNPFGLFDMLGNMWEWCLDGWSEHYPDKPDDGRAVPPVHGKPLVVRGGSWKNPVEDARSANRNHSEPVLNAQDIGFRVAASWGNGLTPRKLLVSGADKIQIFGSPLGMYSLLRDEFIISVLKDDGSLDLEELNKMVARIANMGANALRDFYWIDTQEAYETISPFWREQDGFYRFNDLYFDNQRTIAETCNRYGIRYYLSIFDHNGTITRRGRSPGQWNPWRFFSDYFYGEDAKEMRHRYILRVVEVFKGLDVGLEICNEPRAGEAEFLADTFIYLLKRGFNHRKIIIGIDYGLKERGGAYGNDYRAFRDNVVNTLGRTLDQWLKSRCISPFHNATIENINDLWGDTERGGGTRRILYSMDGVANPSPDKFMMYKIARKVLDKKTEAREKGKVHFEVVYGKTSNEPLDAIEGVSFAYRKTWGRYPANYGKYPQPLMIEEIEDDVTLDDEFGFDVGDIGTGKELDSLKAYDVYEPNNDIIRAKYISLGKPIEANIMDNTDVDFYRIKTSSKKVSIIISIENQSTTLQPYIDIFDENKVLLNDVKRYYEATPGQNLEITFSAGPGMFYYIRIVGINGSHGAYRLTVSEKKDLGTGKADFETGQKTVFMNFQKISLYHSKSANEYYLVVIATDDRTRSANFDTLNVHIRLEMIEGKSKFIDNEDLKITCLGTMYNEIIGKKVTLFRFNMLIDNSGSIDQERLGYVQRGLARFIEEMPLVFDAQVIQFAESIQLKTPFTKDKRLLIDAINQSMMREKSSLLDAIYYGVQELKTKKDEIPLRFSVVLTDSITKAGLNDSGSISIINKIISECRKHYIPLFIVGITDSVDSQLLSEISQYGYYQHIERYPDIDKAFQLILKIIKDTYIFKIPAIGNFQDIKTLYIIKKIPGGNYETIQDIIVH